MYLNGQLYLEPVTTIANQMVMMTLPRFKKSAYNFQEWKDMYEHTKVVSFMLIEKNNNKGGQESYVLLVQTQTGNHQNYVLSLSHLFQHTTISTVVCLLYSCLQTSQPPFQQPKVTVIFVQKRSQLHMQLSKILTFRGFISSLCTAPKKSNFSSHKPKVLTGPRGQHF